MASGPPPPPLPVPADATSVYACTVRAGTQEWCCLVEYVLFPPLGPEHDEWNLMSENVGPMRFFHAEIPADRIEASLGLARYLYMTPAAGTPTMNVNGKTIGAQPRCKRTRTLEGPIGEQSARTPHTATDFRDVLRAAGFDSVEAWIERYWSDRPKVTPALAESTFVTWMAGNQTLGEEFVPRDK